LGNGEWELGIGILKKTGCPSAFKASCFEMLYCRLWRPLKMHVPCYAWPPGRAVVIGRGMRDDVLPTIILTPTIHPYRVKGAFGAALMLPIIHPDGVRKNIRGFGGHLKTVTPGWHPGAINRSTPLGLGNSTLSLPRISSGAIIVQPFQGWS